MSASDSEPFALKGETHTEEPDRAQRGIARRSAEARATIPHLELATGVDFGAALALAGNRGCSITAILVRACALGLRDHPRANGAYRDGRYELHSRVNVGVVILTADAQVTPTVLDADTKSLEQLDAELGPLLARGRAGALTPPELAGATFTLVDVSASAIDRFSPLVVPPHAAALAAGAVKPAAAVKNGTIVAAEIATLTLACDHRILFGQRAAQFLGAVSARVEQAAL